jgi:DNA repair exonuclease SbcCD nuclease subunit
MRLIHTADWQIGKVFRQFGTKEESLQRARLDAIEAIGRLAGSERAEHVLVAGDIYDSDTPAEVTLRAPLERMRLFPKVQWHLLPGNHDPHRPQGIWDRVLKVGTPANVHVHLAAEPVPLGDTAVLLPAPLTRKSETRDLSAWMDAAESAAGLIRIGLAHGAIAGFSSEGEASNPIDPGRPATARLDYLALGDWHRTMQAGPALWYAGTPEPDRAGSQEQGTALVVDIATSGAAATVREVVVGTYRWLTRDESLNDGSELPDLETRLRAIENISRVVLRLRLTGTITLAAHAELTECLRSVEAAVCHLQVEESALRARPTAADLETIDFDGVLRRAADKLLAQMSDPDVAVGDRRRAEDALVQLYVMVAPAEAA